MMTIRLDPELEARLVSLSQKKGISKSAVIKEALQFYLKQEKIDKTPYELGADLFGVDSGSNVDTNASVTYKKKIKEKLRKIF